MSYFLQRPDKNNSSGISFLRRKEAGSSLAVDILRGRGSAKPDFTVGCLTSTASPQLSKLYNRPTILPIYTEEVPFEGSIESGTVVDSLLSNQNSPIRSRRPKPPPPPPPSRQECFPLTDIYKDIYPSHSIQRRPANMGWTGSRSLDGWRFENNIFYENPLSFFPGDLSVAKERGIETLPTKTDSSRNGSENNLDNCGFKNSSEKAPFKRITQPLRSVMSTDDETLYPHISTNHPRLSMNSTSSPKPYRQRSPWKSFLKESTVPDVPVDKRESPTRKTRSSRLKLLSPNHHRLSLEKSVTWKDDKRKPRKVDKQALATQTSIDMQAIPMDDLISVLADLCDTLEHSSIFLPASVKRETSPDICLPSSTQSLSKMTDYRRRSVELSREVKQLSIRSEKNY
ncbi:hypothetical protein ACTXT7_008663 [Hymenolepis weldensis]